MVIICPYCKEEITLLLDSTCPECGSYLSQRRAQKLEWPQEDEWTETDWGEDIEEVTESTLSKFVKEI